MFFKKKNKVKVANKARVNHDYSFANGLTHNSVPVYDVAFLHAEDAIQQADLLLSGADVTIINKVFYDANLEIKIEQANAEFDRQEQEHLVWIRQQLIAVGSEKIKVMDRKDRLERILELEPKDYDSPLRGKRDDSVNDHGNEDSGQYSNPPVEDPALNDDQKHYPMEYCNDDHDTVDKQMEQEDQEYNDIDHVFDDDYVPPVDVQ